MTPFDQWTRKLNVCTQDARAIARIRTLGPHGPTREAERQLLRNLSQLVQELDLLQAQPPLALQPDRSTARKPKE